MKKITRVPQIRTALQAWRLRRQLSIQDLADKAGFSAGTITKMERLYASKYPPSWRVIDAIAGVLQVPSCYLADSSRSLVVLIKKDYYAVVRGEYPDPWYINTGRPVTLEQAIDEAGLNWEVTSEPEVASEPEPEPEPEKDLDDEFFFLQSDPIPEVESNPANNTRVIYLGILAQAIASCYADAQDSTNSLISRALVRLASNLSQVAQEFEHDLRHQSH